ncbi:NADH-ubiquinone oxidoreductase-F iron-sulfur binding region domain-containing protein [Adlercreutzia sp. ZJ473]|uniref:NADH-ubiquinone oxidoreductase-F iron-sulfur binding region domain-containing protein n=1 Tax=Adlercreutzia sp. ZJ473 TaxID=2722822 RepID=UPI001554645C|nr:NADH-ubiquinone oxidoreductase-F iron-sulfur binding region domain-containing protein [Adlercreutzia sp. ZJ473]
MELRIVEELEKKGSRQLESYPRVAVGMGTCGIAAGSQAVCQAFSEALDACEDVRLDEVGCRGTCWAEPLVEVHMAKGSSVLLGSMTPFKAKRLAANLQACKGSELSIEKVSKGLSSCVLDYSDIDAYQTRVLLADCGKVDPLSLPQYCAIGGFAAFERALLKKDPTALIGELERSDLRGRGGAGFSTGAKWRAVAEASARRGESPVVIVNADEGDPGAYMDRNLLESLPFRVLEGAMLALVALGASQAYVFIRKEYPLACSILRKAVSALENAGLLGDDVLGSGRSLRIGIIQSAGSYVCGEETSLIAAIEGRVPRPRKRPPYPSEQGLWGLPTLVGNVETFANVSLVFLRGAEWFSSIGAWGNSGTKVFSLTGDAMRVGLVEVELGTPVSRVVDEIGRAENVKAVQIGGPSGAFLPNWKLDVLLEYESLAEAGAVMGSGGLVVLGEDRCMVELTRYLADFSAKASCGRCLACRDGLRECAALLEKLTEGSIAADALSEVATLIQRIEKGSLCNLGKFSIRPIASALVYFEDEFVEHGAGLCRGRACRDLIRLEIDKAKCQGERCCLQTCPGTAIKGRFGKPGTIDQDLCLKCFTCIDVCPYNAVVIIGR